MYTYRVTNDVFFFFFAFSSWTAYLFKHCSLRVTVHSRFQHDRGRLHWFNWERSNVASAKQNVIRNHISIPVRRKICASFHFNVCMPYKQKTISLPYDRVLRLLPGKIAAKSKNTVCQQHWECCGTDANKEAATRVPSLISDVALPHWRFV